MLRQQDLLIDAKRFFAASETQMIRRWAISRSTTLTLIAVISIVALAFASLHTANHFRPSVWVANIMFGFPRKEPPTAPDQWVENER